MTSYAVDYSTARCMLAASIRHISDRGSFLARVAFCIVFFISFFFIFFYLFFITMFPFIIKMLINVSFTNFPKLPGLIKIATKSISLLIMLDY